MSSGKVRIGLSGAAGRMGQEIIPLIGNADFPNTVLTVALESVGSKNIGDKTNNSGVSFATDFETDEVDVFIDFSSPPATIELLSKCRRHKIPMVIGVTGFSEDEKSIIHEAAKDIPVVFAPNMSLGMNVAFMIAEVAAKILDNYDTEIFEAHHRHKKDAPSGSALRLGEAVTKGRNEKLDDVAVHGWHGKSRKEGDKSIGFSVMRAGDIAGEHRVVFAGGGEQLEIIHRASGRICFARGAIFAAEFTTGVPPGLYDIRNVMKFRFQD